MACKRTSMAPDVVAGTIDAYHDGLMEKVNRLDKATGGAGNAKIPVIWKFGTLGTIVSVSGAALSNDTQGVEKAVNVAQAATAGTVSYYAGNIGFASGLVVGAIIGAPVLTAVVLGAGAAIAGATAVNYIFDNFKL